MPEPEELTVIVSGATMIGSMFGVVHSTLAIRQIRNERRSGKAFDGLIRLATYEEVERYAVSARLKRAAEEASGSGRKQAALFRGGIGVLEAVVGALRFVASIPAAVSSWLQVPHDEALHPETRLLIARRRRTRSLLFLAVSATVLAVAVFVLLRM